MARLLTPKQKLLPSLLDRLLYDAPEAQLEQPEVYSQTLEDLHEAVKRDLEQLLNTRRRCGSWPAEWRERELKQLQSSLVNYGLPDFMAMNLVSDEGRETFRRMLEDTIRCCESRLERVKVSLLDNTEPLDRTMRFRIEALLRAEPAPEAIAFDSILEPVTCSFTLKRSSDGR